MLKDFFYIDRDLLLMYFAQLPSKDRLKFRKEYRTDLELELSFTPKIGTKRERSDLPDSVPVALASFLGQWLSDHKMLGSTYSFAGHFIVGEFDVRYTRLPRGILIAFPVEGIPAQMRKFGQSFVILGNSENCNHQWNRPISGYTDASALEKLHAVWEDICKNRIKDMQGGPGTQKQWHWRFGLGEEDVFFALMGIAEVVRRRRRRIAARLGGVCRVRTRFQGPEGKLCVLYPLFLERLNDESVT